MPGLRNSPFGLAEWSRRGAPQPGAGAEQASPRSWNRRPAVVACPVAALFCGSIDAEHAFVISTAGGW